MSSVFNLQLMPIRMIMANSFRDYCLHRFRYIYPLNIMVLVAYTQKMAGKALTDNLWEQLQVTMVQHGRYRKNKNREVMETPYRRTMA